MRLILIVTVCLWGLLFGTAAAQDTDGDGIADSVDNCPMDFNPDQEDSDEDGVGDSCETCCRYVGDIDHDGNDQDPQTGQPDISDLIYLVNFMFHSGPCDAMCNDGPDCTPDNAILPEADYNCDGKDTPDIADLIFMVHYMFCIGPPSPCWDFYTPACNRP